MNKKDIKQLNEAYSKVKPINEVHYAYPGNMAHLMTHKSLQSPVSEPRLPISTDQIAHEVTSRVWDLFEDAVNNQRRLSEPCVKRIVLSIIEKYFKDRGQHE